MTQAEKIKELKQLSLQLWKEASLHDMKAAEMGDGEDKDAHIIRSLTKLNISELINDILAQ